MFVQWKIDGLFIYKSTGRFYTLFSVCNIKAELKKSDQRRRFRGPDYHKEAGLEYPIIHGRTLQSATTKVYLPRNNSSVY